MIADLHCHSNASDGSLSPPELVERARLQGVQMLAITDHDTLDGYWQVAPCEELDLVAGIELSCVWGKASVHIVGLNVDPMNSVLCEGIARQHEAREKRALVIAERLEKRGFTGSYEGALKLAAGGQLGRPHFAQFLVDSGQVGSFNEVFKKYLGAGKPGDVKALWPGMDEVVGWILASGGVPVLAHPLHYKMTATRLRGLLVDFKGSGGLALEVNSGQQAPDRTRYLSQLCQQFDLFASCGSDFHRPGQAWNELGTGSQLPASCRPVWSLWSQGDHQEQDTLC